MKRFTLTFSILALLMVGSFSTVLGARTHIINYGDTLWDLSIQYYSNPFYWEDILRANPSVRGVEYLIPGEELLIPDLGVQQTTNYDPVVSGGLYTVSSTSSAPLLSRMVIETAGMVTVNPPQPAGYIIDTDVEEQDVFEDVNSYSGDLVALDIGVEDGVQPDMVYKIYQVGEEVTQPQTGEKLGNVIRVAGICRVVQADQSSCVALLEHSNIPVLTGDFVVPYDADEPIPVSTSSTVDDLDANILALRDPEMGVAYSYDVVYIDKGSAQGLNPGDIFYMYKYGSQVMSPSGNTEQIPDIPVSQMIVLDTTENTSAVMIFSISTSELIKAGDRIELKQRQL